MCMPPSRRRRDDDIPTTPLHEMRRDAIAPAALRCCGSSSCGAAPPATSSSRKSAKVAYGVPGRSNAAKTSTWAASGWRATASRRGLVRRASPRECGGQPLASGCSPTSCWWPAVASPRRPLWPSWRAAAPQPEARQVLHVVQLGRGGGGGVDDASERQLGLQLEHGGARRRVARRLGAVALVEREDAVERLARAAPREHLRHPRRPREERISAWSQTKADIEGHARRSGHVKRGQRLGPPHAAARGAARGGQLWHRRRDGHS